MNDSTAPVLNLERAGAVLRVWLNRPDVHNAFDTDLIAELTRVFREAATDAELRVVVLGGRGKSFCAGADIGMMKAIGAMTPDENRTDARRLAALFAAIDECPKAVVARVQGAALGGGTGLISACDVAIAEAGCRFGFTEVKLGILPAVISPFVVAKIGTSAARAHFTAGDRFDAAEALRIGLIHEVVPDAAALDAAVERRVNEFLTAAPGAVAAAKNLVARLAEPGFRDREVATAFTADLIAERRASDEGREGLAAFLERRKPNWTPDS
jgi:methylglutaconyl-CoA hydratase